MLESLKIALCGEEPVAKPVVETPEEKTITMSGPLSEIFTQALQIVYAKKDEATGETAALESQANDATMAIALLKASVGVIPAPGRQLGGNIIRGNYTNNYGVYAIPMAEVTPDMIPTAALALTTPSAERNQENYIVIHTDTSAEHRTNVPVHGGLVNANDGVGPAPVHPYAALEAQCKEFGIGLIVGFENLVTLLNGKGKETNP